MERLAKRPLAVSKLTPTREQVKLRIYVITPYFRRAFKCNHRIKKLKHLKTISQFSPLLSKMGLITFLIQMTPSTIAKRRALVNCAEGF